MQLEQRAIILCGGRGTRMGALTDRLPKSMVSVHGKPLIWYIISMLYRRGVRHFILPLGYRGNAITDYIYEAFFKFDCEFHCIETGEHTPIAKRLEMVSPLLKDDSDFLLVNGDTIFDFDLLEMLNHHQNTHALVTLSSVEVTSHFGLIIEKAGKVADFRRESRVHRFQLSSDNTYGYINSGISWMNKKIFHYFSADECENFEMDVFPHLIQEEKLSHWRVNGIWYCIDTRKDLDILNGECKLSKELEGVVKQVKKDIVSRYSYKNKYIDEPDAIMKRILAKTIVPHQVEVQPGPLNKKKLCWLNCPYCYGGTAQNTGERLTPERYCALLQQTAHGPHGGINKVVFAGYATDPLNYEYIEDLLSIVINNKQIFGFHTKVLQASQRLIDLITKPDIQQLSYFSVSLDAGSLQSYNRVHGVAHSQTNLYQKVLKNITRITTAREKNAAPLEVSVTYLITRENNSPEEIQQCIEDVRETNADILRFTFPQIPRGQIGTVGHGVIPSRKEVLEDLTRLKPIIERNDSEQMAVIIMDLDKAYNFREDRSFPCIARFIYPSIGFDGYLSHCSESAAPHFRDMVLGNLQTSDFWDLFYDYDVENFIEYMQGFYAKMAQNDCRCDRKEHVVNSFIRSSGVFDRLESLPKE